ncbi:sigma-70 family RNA polymerase sigma factor [Pseudoxanthomonas winnipegensis]|nr:sigma-70 family RNA polymerase sigma factor [Pseudoxanthomonas winnipegensis]
MLEVGHVANHSMSKISEEAFTVEEEDTVCALDEVPLDVDALVRTSHVSLIQFLRSRLRCPEDAHDVVQETYIRMLQYNGSTALRSPTSMLFRIAINVANDLKRSERVRHVSHQCNIDDFELTAQTPSSEQHVQAKQELSIVRQTIEELPLKCRTVFLLSRARGMTYPEIARHCGISVKMVEKHISHALAVCMSRVAKQNGTISGH